MKRFQTGCSSCGEHVWTTMDAVGQTASCPKCRSLFTVSPPAAPPSASATRLHLKPDPFMQRLGLDAYQKFAAGRIATDSTVTEVLRMPYPSDEEGIAAYDNLSNARSRLQVDIFMYPVWLQPEEGQRGRV